MLSLVKLLPPACRPGGRPPPLLVRWWASPGTATPPLPAADAAMLAAAAANTGLVAAVKEGTFEPVVPLREVSGSRSAAATGSSGVEGSKQASRQGCSSSQCAWLSKAVVAEQFLQVVDSRGQRAPLLPSTSGASRT